ncbi:MAG TPA: AAA family ATPase [Dehalococcoidia bacterium]|nr:AAA family ATPase [Dehalococcoidia bacterium]
MPHHDTARASLPPLIAGLLDPAAYPHPVERVDLIQTHISYVLLAGEFAYKVKKPLDLGFLDYSTLGRRREMCEEEVRLNQRQCSGVYLGVVPIADGPTPRIAGDGPPAEYAVRMRRVPHDRTLPALLEAGQADTALVARIGRTIAAFHASAPAGESVATHGRTPAVRRNARENFDQLRPFVGHTISATELAELESYTERSLAQHHGLIEARADAGRVRDVHGDLRADSIVVQPDGALCVMDCIEFSERIRCCDVASDIAFLAMDLERRGRRDLAAELMAAYLDDAADETLPVMLPFYACYRAVIRAKVESLLLLEPEVDANAKADAVARARAHVELALRYARRQQALTLVFMVGLSGSGKSYLAGAVASRLGAALVATDAVRRELYGRPEAPAPPDTGIYTKARRERVYRETLARARAHLLAGRSVVLDATHARKASRRSPRTLAAQCSARVLAVEVGAPADVVRARMEERARREHAASDARWEVYLRQREQYQPPREMPPEEVVTVDATQPVGSSVEAVLERLGAAP